MSVTVSPAEAARRDRFRVFMDVYYFGRQADLDRLEAETGLYPAEVAEWIERNGHPLYFRKYLEESRGMPR